MAREGGSRCRVDRAGVSSLIRGWVWRCARRGRRLLFGVIDDFEAFGEVEELGIGLGGGEVFYGEDLLTALRVVDFGDEVDAELSGVPELAGGDHRLIVADDSGVERGGFAVAGGVDAGGGADAELFVLVEAVSIG